jgi:signal transduction histidine kinase
MNVGRPPYWAHYPLAIALQIAMLWLRLRLPGIPATTPGLILFLIPIIPSAYFGGLGPGLVSTFCAAILTDFFLLKPVGTLWISNPFNIVQWVTLIGLGVAATVSIHRPRVSRRRAQEAEAASRKTLETFRCFVEQSPNAAAIFDLDLRYIAASNRWIEELCPAHPAPAGWHLYDTIPDIPPDGKLVVESAVKGQGSQLQMFEWQRADGKTYWHSAAFVPWTDGEGKIGGLIIGAKDESAQRQLAEELKRAHDAVQATERAKSALLAGRSHELRTPLNAVIGYSEALLSGIFGDFAQPRQREYVVDIHDAGSHLLEIVNDVLDTSALVAQETVLEETSIDIAAKIAKAVRFLGPLAMRGGVIVASDCADDLPPVRGDARRLLQVLLNLISNAIKFSNPGDQVTISARADATALTLTVADTGLGMTEEELKQIGSPFAPHSNSLVQSRKGAGLGLYLSEGLVAIHGGKMTIESAKGGGTTVTVILPADRISRPLREAG